MKIVISISVLILRGPGDQPATSRSGKPTARSWVTSEARDWPPRVRGMTTESIRNQVMRGGEKD